MSVAGIQQRLDEISTITVTGRVVKAVGLTLEATGLGVSVGQRCHIFSRRRQAILEGEVIGFREQRVIVMPFGPVRGIGAGDLVRYDPTSPRLLVGPHLLGRVVDGLGQPIDDKGPLPRSQQEEVTALEALPPSARFEGFFRYWTLKEAYIKALGAGLSVALDSFAISPQSQEPVRFLRSDRGDSANWTLHTLEPAERYAAAVVTEGAENSVTGYDFPQPSE